MFSVGDFVGLKRWPEYLKDTRTSHFEAFVTRADDATVDVVFSNGQQIKGLAHAEVEKKENTHGIPSHYFTMQIEARRAEHRVQYYHWARAQGMSKSSAKSPSLAVLNDFIQSQEFK